MTTDRPLDSCGCCAGLVVETPAPITNPYGQTAVAYRVGVQASFKASLLARLSGAELPALAGLSARDDDDFTIALCDALATTLDVLTFYQERIANENFLRTATEQHSLVALARLVGYQPAPGMAAATHLAFTLQEAPGNPALAAPPVDIPVATRVQSVPGPGEQPQTFETVEAVPARAEWNAMPVRASTAWRPRAGDRALWLAGVGNQVQAGDVILMVGQQRLPQSGSAHWDIRLLTAVEPDPTRQRTRLVWDEALGEKGAAANPAEVETVVLVFRQRAALFGHNAPDATLFYDEKKVISGLINSPEQNARFDVSNARVSIHGANLAYPDRRDEPVPPIRYFWKEYERTDAQIDLDTAYPKVTPGSWIALVSGVVKPGAVKLYVAKSVSFPSRTDFALSGKITRIEPDTALGTGFDRRNTLVLAQPEPLPVKETPLNHPLYGERLELGRPARDIPPGRALAIRGKRARLRFPDGTADVTLRLIADDSVVTPRPGESLRIAAAPEQMVGGVATALAPQAFGAWLAQSDGAPLQVRVLDRDGREARLSAKPQTIALASAEATDDEVQEIVYMSDLQDAISETGEVTLAAGLEHCYDHETVRVNANVARATHGETISEVVGSGDARLANASFPLRQAPLTFVSSSAAPSGRESTLALRVNDLLWQAVPSLYARGPTERVYETAIDHEARTTVRCGDGVEGARLPSGDHNVRASYRKGLGLAGNVQAGSLTTLLTRPLGVTGASNPEAASGGEDPERADQARENAPSTVRTLDRIVSLQDYEDYARAFPGIAKAHATWLPVGPARGVFLTVAGERGEAVADTGDTYRHLQRALQRYGDPVLGLRLHGHRAVHFRLRLSVRTAVDAEPDRVLAALETRLREAFGFAARRFGQGVAVDEVAAVGQSVAGVEAVHVAELRRGDAPVPLFVARLFAALPLGSLGGPPLAAELLTLDPAPLSLELMP